MTCYKESRSIHYQRHASLFHEHDTDKVKLLLVGKALFAWLLQLEADSIVSKTGIMKDFEDFFFNYEEG